jgi:hypothetical protein
MKLRSGERTATDFATLQGGQRLFANWAILCLPFIEEQATYDRFDLNADGNVRISDAVNLAARGTQIAVMLCPSDRGAGQLMSLNGGNWARGNYALNGGQYLPLCGKGSAQFASCDPQQREEPWSRGVGPFAKGMPLRQIKDSASKTILLLELRVGLSERDRRGVWAMGLPGSSVHFRHASNRINSPNSCQPGDDEVKDGNLVIQDIGQPRLRQECMMPDTGYDQSAQSVARSTHRGGVVTAFCDGSAKLISDDVEAGAQNAGMVYDSTIFRTWQRLNVSQDALVIENEY